MPRVAPAVPSESDLLCETCGYTLAGLPDDANCPECGTPVSKSLPDTRKPSRWERHRTAANFWRDTAATLTSPTHFFRSLATRGGFKSSDAFGVRQLYLASALFVSAAFFHWLIVFNYGSTRGTAGQRVLVLVGFILLGSAVPVVLMLVTNLAAKLTEWEGRYRGYRLPYSSVRRVLAFHAACYLPVGLLAVLTTGGYCLCVSRDGLPPDTLVTYLYVLSAEVVLAAGYLFNTYWRAMRATMWANG